MKAKIPIPPPTRSLALASLRPTHTRIRCNAAESCYRLIWMHEPGVDRSKHQASLCQNRYGTPNSPAFFTVIYSHFLGRLMEPKSCIRLLRSLIWQNSEITTVSFLPGCSGGASKSSVLLRKQMRRTRWKMAGKNRNCWRVMLRELSLCWKSELCEWAENEKSDQVVKQ